jgi:hypothetical protein
MSGSGHWRKLGRLWEVPAQGRHPKLLTHAANPLPVHLAGDVHRVFYSGRDARNRSSVGAVDIDIARGEVVQDHPQPFFEHGPEGSFFADGVSIGNCYTAGGMRYMLFMGWRSPANGHWYGEVGRLVLGPDLHLTLDDEHPFMPLTREDPVSLSYPCVEPRTEGGYRMWYGSTVSWDAGNGEMLHTIKTATSPDGHSWTREGQAVPARLGVAQAFSRPTVASRPDGGLEMWFSYRSGTGEKYRIGYAETDDEMNWRLALDKAGIAVSPEGWDSDMIEYPFVWKHGGKQYMLYNGNGYGKTGFGLAVRDNT